MGRVAVVRRWVACAAVLLAALGVAGPAARAEEPLFRGLVGVPFGTAATFRLNITRRTSLNGQVLELPGAAAEFRLVSHTPDAEGHRLVELVYTRFSVDGDPDRTAQMSQSVVGRPFQALVDQDGNFTGPEPPAGFRMLGFDVRRLLGGAPIPAGTGLGLRPGEKVTGRGRSSEAPEGIPLTTESETILEYAGRVTREGAERDLILLSVESRSGLASGAAHYLTQTQGRLYADPLTGTLSEMVLETAVIPPDDTPGLPLSATRVEVRLLGLQPLSP